MHAVALTARQFANILLLVLALKVERAHIGPRRHIVAIDLHIIEPV